MYQIKRGDEVIAICGKDTVIHTIMNLLNGKAEELDIQHLSLSLSYRDLAMKSDVRVDPTPFLIKMDIQPIAAKYGLTITKE